MILRWWVSQAQKLIGLSDDGDMLVLEDAQISRANWRVRHEQDHVVKLLRQFNVSQWLDGLGLFINAENFLDLANVCQRGVVSYPQAGITAHPQATAWRLETGRRAVQLQPSR